MATSLGLLSYKDERIFKDLLLYPPSLCPTVYRSGSILYLYEKAANCICRARNEWGRVKNERKMMTVQKTVHDSDDQERK